MLLNIHLTKHLYYIENIKRFLVFTIYQNMVFFILGNNLNFETSNANLWETALLLILKCFFSNSSKILQNILGKYLNGQE